MSLEFALHFKNRLKVDAAEMPTKLSIFDIDQINAQLTNYELVSLVFLLYDNEHVALERLVVASHNQFNSVELLNEWVRAVKDIDDNWKNKLLEALAVIQNYCILQQLGYEKDEIYSRFLPLNTNVSLYLLPLKKALYRFCETLNITETRRLIEIIDVDCQTLGLEGLDTIIEDSDKYFEFSLLKFMVMKYITISNLKKNDVSRLVKILINNKYNEWAQILSKIENDYNLEILKITAELKPDRKIDSNTNKETKPTEMENDTVALKPDQINYPMHFDRAGLCIIINQRNFFYDESHPMRLLMERNLEDRQGTDVDCNALAETWKRFGFEISIHENLNHDKVIKQITLDINNKFYNHYCCLILCILSHGKSGVIFGTDCISVQTIDIENCVFSQPVLLRKPKILIYQACQGSSTQKIPTSFIDNHIVTDCPTKGATQFENGTLLKSDYVICWPTVDGFAALRHIYEGSWFISSLCKALNKNGHRLEFLDILRLVILEVESKKYKKNCVVIPEFRTAFGKKLYFKLKNG